MEYLYLSECCGAPFPEPGHPDTDLCGECKDHTGAVKEPVVNTRVELKESDIDIIASFIDDHTTSDEEFFKEFTMAIFNNLGWKYYPMDKKK